MNAIRELVSRLDSDERVSEVIVSTTTDTGYARAKEAFGDQHRVVRYPFDVSWAVRRFLKAVQPDVVGLVELEVWPNFTAACRRRGIPVCVINGRLSERSFWRYRLLRGLIRPSFGRLSRAAVQDERYAARFQALGVSLDQINVVGTMKWDTAILADAVEGADDLAEDMGINRDIPLVVAGSTARDEHALLHAAVPDGVQLLCAPRKPEWFEQAASDLPGCVRRSGTSQGDISPMGTHRFLLDSMGELRKAYALADVVVVGRSFGDLYGSDMMEPIALGKATIIGPAYGDFLQMMDDLLEGGGIICTTRDELPEVLKDLLENPERRSELAKQGREVIRQQQGATKRHVEILLGLKQEHSK